MKLLLLLPLLLGLMSPAIAHNEANGGEECGTEANYCISPDPVDISPTDE